uniref:Uncharacterized protein n=1 Tax=Clastoptera arizonana TaxID=38151 RepID=A0A1B6CUD6_9HEMI
MVLKKSEYKMQYNKITNELRKQIWQDNINVRCNRRSSNQAHHYWEFQVSEGQCACSDDDGQEEQKIRAKHQSLLEKFEKQNKLRYEENLEKKVGSEEKVRDIGNQTPEWKPDGLESRTGKSSDELFHNISSQSLKIKKGRLSRSSSPDPTKYSAPRPRTTAGLSSIRPSRTTRKLHSEGKKTHFVPYGWNEESIEVGKKKTYNVCAPDTQVHEVAMLASKRRNASVERFITEEIKGRRNLSKKNTDVKANHSSIWMTEYQEQFSRKENLQRCTRPNSAPPIARCSTWRYS